MSEVSPTQLGLSHGQLSTGQAWGHQGQKVDARLISEPACGCVCFILLLSNLIRKPNSKSCLSIRHFISGPCWSCQPRNRSWQVPEGCGERPSLCTAPHVGIGSVLSDRPLCASYAPFQHLQNDLPVKKEHKPQGYYWFFAPTR